MLENLAANPLESRRLSDEPKHAIRDEFDRDRDRILYSKEFRRLSGKTQVFISSHNDDIRTRLTHTLEVAQIAKTLCKFLGLNQTLAEAIAFGHDVGHTPFGHVGERVLNQILNGCEKIKDYFDRLEEIDAGFKHNWQSLRVVTKLEKIDKDFEGLNLTDYTLWGMLHHTSTTPKECQLLNGDICGIRHSPHKCHRVKKGLTSVLGFGFYQRNLAPIAETSWTFEALIVRLADEIAQRNHDLQDGIFAGILEQREIISQINTHFHSFLSNEVKKRLKELKRQPNINLFIMSISKILLYKEVLNFVPDPLY